VCIYRSFPAVAYIQKGKLNKKALTFSRGVPTPVALLVDAEEGLNVYESHVRYTHICFWKNK